MTILTPHARFDIPILNGCNDDPAHRFVLIVSGFLLNSGACTENIDHSLAIVAAKE